MNERQARKWLSEPRYQRLRREVRTGDHDSALLLYEWHVAFAMASFGLIHHFEVLLRNAVDGVLGEGQPETPIGETWMLDLNVLRPGGMRQVVTAIDRLEKGAPVSRGRVVASLSFAFWADLFGRSYEELWRESLHHAFPHGTVTRKAVGIRLARVRRFRNRVAHHDWLFGQDVSALVEDMLQVAAWIDPNARVWLERQTGARQVAEQVARLDLIGAARLSSTPG